MDTTAQETDTLPTPAPPALVPGLPPAVPLERARQVMGVVLDDVMQQMQPLLDEEAHAVYHDLVLTVLSAHLFFLETMQPKGTLPPWTINDTLLLLLAFHGDSPQMKGAFESKEVHREYKEAVGRSPDRAAVPSGQRRSLLTAEVVAASLASVHDSKAVFWLRQLYVLPVQEGGRRTVAETLTKLATFLVGLLGSNPLLTKKPPAASVLYTDLWPRLCRSIDCNGWAQAALWP